MDKAKKPEAMDTSDDPSKTTRKGRGSSKPKVIKKKVSVKEVSAALSSLTPPKSTSAIACNSSCSQGSVKTLASLTPKSSASLTTAKSSNSTTSSSDQALSKTPKSTSEHHFNFTSPKSSSQVQPSPHTPKSRSEHRSPLGVLNSTGPCNFTSPKIKVKASNSPRCIPYKSPKGKAQHLSSVNLYIIPSTLEVREFRDSYGVDRVNNVISVITTDLNVANLVIDNTDTTDLDMLQRMITNQQFYISAFGYELKSRSVVKVSKASGAVSNYFTFQKYALLY